MSQANMGYWVELLVAIAICLNGTAQGKSNLSPKMLKTFFWIYRTGCNSRKDLEIYWSNYFTKSSIRDAVEDLLVIEVI